MLSGVAIAAKHINPKIIVIGAEPFDADDAFRSFKSKKRIVKHTKRHQRLREKEKQTNKCEGRQVGDFKDDHFVIDDYERDDIKYDDDESLDAVEDDGQIIASETIADGLRTCLGEITFPIILSKVDYILRCSEKEIYSSTKLIWERMKLFVEPSSGVGLAVSLYNETFKKMKNEKGWKKVGVILCGGNIDIQTFRFPE